jgi:hypothetical protein
MTLAYNSLSWTKTSLGASFYAYELWRNDTGTFVQIASITNENTVTFKDYEALRNTNAQYEIRVRRTDGAVSDLSTPTSSVQALMASGRIGFVSNELPVAQYVEAVDLTPRQYTFPERAQTHEMYGRTGAVTFKATETQGDAFVVKLLLAAQGGVDGLTTTPSTPGRAVFEPIRALTRAQASYICVLDSDGNRWYASISVGPQRTDAGAKFSRGYAERREPGQIYTVDVSVHESTRTPSTPASGPT